MPRPGERLSYELTWREQVGVDSIANPTTFPSPTTTGGINMDMTQDQMRKEFERQVHLCSGLGREVMLRIVEARFPPAHSWEFYANGSFCRKCGCAAGDGRECRR